MLLGIASLVLRDQLISNWQLAGGLAFIIVTSVAQIAGGASLLFRKTSAAGAVILGAVYLVCTLTFVPGIVAEPKIYASWGNVFYQLALVVGAVAAYALQSPFYSAAVCRGATILLGLCSISYAIEQVEFLARTISLVPRWIPPGGEFWSIATAVAFVLAGIALVIGYRAILASRLLASMLLIFVVAVWVPILIADPAMASNWSEGIETLAIAAVAWAVSDLRKANAGL